MAISGSRPVPEPQHPTPETFGLTKDRADQFKKARAWFSSRLLVVVVLIFLWLLGAMFSADRPRALRTTHPLVLIVYAGAVTFGASLFVAPFLAFPGGWILEALWRRTQRD